MNGTPAYIPKPRNPILIYLLSFITCGIYGWIVIYQMSDEIKQHVGDSRINPAIEVLLCILTCNGYAIYWCYKYSRLINQMQVEAKVSNATDISMITLILAIVGQSMISLLLMQTELNRVWDVLYPNQMM